MEIIRVDDHFGGIIRRLHKANLTTDGLKSTRDRGGQTADIKADNRPAVVEYRQVNGDAANR
jgi:hypothetical protein